MNSSKYDFDVLVKSECLYGKPKYADGKTYKDLTEKQKNDYEKLLRLAHEKKHQLSNLDILFFNTILDLFGVNSPFTVNMVVDQTARSFNYNKNKIRRILTKLEGEFNGNYSCLDAHLKHMYYKKFITFVQDISQLDPVMLKRSNDLKKHANIPYFEHENFYIISDEDLELFKAVTRCE
jgi:hypothetical protein